MSIESRYNLRSPEERNVYGENKSPEPSETIGALS